MWRKMGSIMHGEQSISRPHIVSRTSMKYVDTEKPRKRNEEQH